MKILCFSDLHRDKDAAHRLVEAAKEVDVVIDYQADAGRSTDVVQGTRARCSLSRASNMQ